jgi:hypothetical protein
MPGCSKTSKENGVDIVRSVAALRSVLAKVNRSQPEKKRLKKMIVAAID